jgi:hypothetical protein
MSEQSLEKDLVGLGSSARLETSDPDLQSQMAL